MIFDVSDPTCPLEIGVCNTPGAAIGITISGNYAYIAAEYGGLRIIDISAPTHPFEVGYFDSTGEAYDVEILGNYAYLAYGTGGLIILNIALPSHPMLIGYCHIPEYAYSVAISGNYAYMACGPTGLQIVDITNIQNPSIVGSFDTPGTAREVVVEGNYAYVADYWVGGLRVINVANPSAPFEVGHYDTPGYAWDVKVDGDYAYVADCYYFEILDYSEAMGTIDISIDLIPSITPIVIPRFGGTFDYTILAINNGTMEVSFNLWTNVSLPGRKMYGPIMNQLITLDVGDSLTQILTQEVPSLAPAGDYNFNGYVGIYPNMVWDTDSFPFTKSETEKDKQK
jgi:hypothetical protein